MRGWNHCSRRCLPLLFPFHAESRHRHSRHLEFVEPCMHVGSRNQVPHCSLKRLVTHPVLNCSNIESSSQHSSRICRAECLQIKFGSIKVCPGGDRFASIQHVLFAISRSGRKNELAIATLRVAPQQFSQLNRDRHLALLPLLG